MKSSRRRLFVLVLGLALSLGGFLDDSFAVPLEESENPMAAMMQGILEQTENLSLTKEDMKSIKRQGNTFMVPRWLKQKAIFSIPALGDQATVSRVRAGKEVYGYRIESLSSSSFLPYLGIKTGDIVRTVNGRALSSEEQAYALAAQLTNAEEIEVDLERGQDRQPLRLTYRLVS